MPQCQNCKARLNCACQIRVASDGKSCCSSCVSTYEYTVKTITKGAKLNIISSKPPIDQL
jgi:hypothetical protein